MIQGHLDGFTIEEAKAAFKGTAFELSDGDAEKMSIDTVLFLGVAVRVVPPKFTWNKDTELTRVNVLQVENVRVLEGELREDVIQWLMSANGQQPMDFREKMGLEPADDEDGPGNEGEIVLSPAEVEQITAPHHTPTGEVRSQMPVGGPKAAKFRDWDAPTSAPPAGGEIQGREQLGSVYAAGRKDKALESFLNG